MIADNDHEMLAPQTCPTCGRPWPPTFDAETSALLDWLAVAKEVISEVQAALEKETLP
jgi:hypothetical protein